METKIETNKTKTNLIFSYERFTNSGVIQVKLGSLSIHLLIRNASSAGDRVTNHQVAGDACSSTCLTSRGSPLQCKPMSNVVSGVWRSLESQTTTTTTTTTLAQSIFNPNTALYFLNYPNNCTSGCQGKHVFILINVF